MKKSFMKNKGLILVGVLVIAVVSLGLLGQTEWMSVWLSDLGLHSGGAVLGGSGISLATVAAVGTGTGGVNLNGEPVTSQATAGASPELLTPDIEAEVVRIAPSTTPLHTLTSHCTKRKSDSMVVRVYSATTLEDTDKLAAAYTEPSSANISAQRATLKFLNHDRFDVQDTISVVGQKGHKMDGSIAKQDLMLLVVAKDANGDVTVQAVNGKKIGAVANCVPSISTDRIMLRMGRAAAELDVQTAQTGAVPTPEDAYCQIFKAQVEQGKFNQKASKEVKWDFNDLMEMGLAEFKKGVEKSQLFGVGGVTVVNNKNIYTAEGVWWQVGRSVEVDKMDEGVIVDIQKQSFVGNNGSKSKFAFAGANILSAIAKIDINNPKHVLSRTDEEQFGIKFKKLSTLFGDFNIIHAEILDLTGHGNEMLVIDANLITKAEHLPLELIDLNLQELGLRNSDATVITEASCVYLKNKNAHMVVKLKEAVA